MDRRTDFDPSIQVWEQRHKKDAGLVTAMAIATIIPVLRFAWSPDRVSIWVLIAFISTLLFALGRLIQSTHKLAKLRPMFVSRPVTAADEIFDAYENPAGDNPIQLQSVAGCWMPQQYDNLGRASSPVYKNSLN